MLELNKNDAQSTIVVTLETATKPYFIFKFVHVLTKKTVTFLAGNDLSPYTYRYNEFEVSPSNLFGDMPIGEWHYTVFQSATPDVNIQDSAIEHGKMMLIQNQEFDFVKYKNTPITYTSYGS